MTAIELLEETLNNFKRSSTGINGIIKFSETEFKELFEQSKKIEKQQIINAFNNGCNQEKIGYNLSEQYYKKTFNK